MGVLAKASSKAERTDNALFSAIYTYVRERPLTSGKAQTSVNSYFDIPSFFKTKYECCNIT